MQKIYKMIETLTHVYTSQGIQQELSNEYKHDRVYKVFNINHPCALDASSLSFGRGMFLVLNHPRELFSIADAKADKDFSTVLEPIEKITVPLNYAWRTAKHLNYVHHNAGYRHVFQQVKMGPAL